MTFEQLKQGVRARKWLVAAGVVVVVAILSVALRGQHGADSNYVTAPVTRGAIRNVISATGTVQAVVTVQVGSQVSGQVMALYADYNSVVKQGQLLAQIDPRNFQAQVENAKASLASAQAHVQTVQADLVTQEANLQSAQANLDAARATSENSQLIMKRDQALVQKGVLDQGTYDTARTQADSDRAKVEQARAAIKQAAAQINGDRANLAQARAQVQQARAQLDQTQVNLQYCQIYSPVNGVVISRDVDVGQTVAASLSAPLLFLIANDLTKMEVAASVDEADIGQISTSDPVTFNVDAYPNRTFVGRIKEVRLNSQSVQNVVTYTVIISVDNSDLLLKPAMTANISMVAEHRDNVLKVSNAALRFRPPNVSPAEEARIERGGAEGVRGGAEGMRGGAEAMRGAAEGMRGGAEFPAGHDRGARGGRPADARGAGVAAGSGANPPSGMAGILTGPEPGGQVLAPGQKWNPDDKILFPPAAPPRGRPAVVWVVGPNGQPKPVRVMIGITDGANSEVLSGALHEGDRVITGDMAAGMQRRGGPGGFRFRF